MSNPRFVAKTLKSDPARLSAIIDHFENGGIIRVFPASKRPKRGFTVGKSFKAKNK